MSERTTRSRRLVVALDASPPEPVLELALLAGGPAAELLGVFVEDVRLLEHARSQLAREVLLAGGERPLELAAVERQLQAQSARVRRLFEAAAARRGITPTFEIARGHLAAELARLAAEADALVVALAGAGRPLWDRLAIRELLRAPLRTLLLAREGWASGGTIMVVIDDPDRASQALAAARRLAAASGSALDVLLVGPARRDRARLEALLAGAERPAVTLVEVGAAVLDPVALARAARSRDVRLLVIPAGRVDVEDLACELLARAPSALLLVRD
ncbi:MAG TPA: hypothetical protein VIN61_17790 [Gammaproteobacteria bacterium]